MELNSKLDLLLRKLHIAHKVDSLQLRKLIFENSCAGFPTVMPFKEICSVECKFLKSGELQVSIFSNTPGLLIGKRGARVSQLSGFLIKNLNIHIYIDIKQNPEWIFTEDMYG